MKKYNSATCSIVVLRDSVIATSPRIATTFGDEAKDGDEGCVSGRRGMEDFETY